MRSRSKIDVQGFKGRRLILTALARPLLTLAASVLLLLNNLVIIVEEDVEDAGKAATVEHVLHGNCLRPKEARIEDDGHVVEVHLVLLELQHFASDKVDYIQDNLAVQHRQRVDNIGDQLDALLLLEVGQRHDVVIGFVGHNGIVEFGKKLLDHSCHCVP